MSTHHTTQHGVNTELTPKRRTGTRRYVENHDYAAFASRVIRAHGRRIAVDKDIEALPGLVYLSTQLDHAITDAVAGLRVIGYSWADIALRLGITRQAAQQRWGTRHTDEVTG
jgi:hypothetical protein